MNEELLELARKFWGEHFGTGKEYADTMTVFVVYEADLVIGIFSTKEHANHFLKSAPEYENPVIYEFPVDGERQEGVRVK